MKLHICHRCTCNECCCIRQMAGVFESPGLLPLVVKCVMTDTVDVRKEAGWCLVNAAFGSDMEQRALLVEHDFFGAMSTLLESIESKLVCVGLKGIAVLLDSAEEESKELYGSWLDKCREQGTVEHLHISHARGFVSLDQLTSLARHFPLLLH